MTEIELLRKLNSKKEEQHRLEIEYSFANDIKKVEENKSLLELKTEIQELENTIINIEDKKYSKRAKSQIIAQLISYITQIEAKPKQRLPKSQGLIIENYIFSLIIQDLTRFVTDETDRISIPSHWKYTYDTENSIAAFELIEFLNHEIRLLEDLDQINFVSLSRYIGEMKERLFDRFITQS